MEIEFSKGDRIITIFGELTNEYAEEITKQILGAAGENYVEIYINSVGGDTLGAIAIINAMYLLRLSGQKTTTYVIGEAQSAAGFIFIAGDSRYSIDNTRMMLHYSEIAFEEYKSPKQVNQSVKETKKINESLEKIVLKNCKGMLTKRQIKGILQEGKQLDPEEMLAYGFVDEVICYER